MKRTNKVRLTESQLHRVIKESVKRVLREDLDARRYLNFPSLDDIADEDDNIIPQKLQRMAKKNQIDASWDALRNSTPSDWSYRSGQHRISQFMHGINDFDGIPNENPNMFDDNGYSSMEQLRHNDENGKFKRFAKKKISKNVGGYEVNISFDQNGCPKNAEISEIKSGGQDFYYDMSLTYDGSKLVDYDGAYAMPKPLSVVLKKYGFETEE